MKKPHAVKFNKRNAVHPFEDASPIEFFAKKNDASLFAIGSHSKKRPNNLILARTFDYHILDMIELGIENCIPMSAFPANKCAVDQKPAFVFNGDGFEQNEDLIKLKSLLLDFFHGRIEPSVNVTGLEHVISVTALPGEIQAEGDEDAANEDVEMADADDATTATKKPKLSSLYTQSSTKVFFRVYALKANGSQSSGPNIELQEMGPSLDLVVRRTQYAPDDVWKDATKIPRELKVGFGKISGSTLECIITIIFSSTAQDHQERQTR